MGDEGEYYGMYIRWYVQGQNPLIFLEVAIAPP